MKTGFDNVSLSDPAVITGQLEWTSFDNVGPDLT